MARSKRLQVFVSSTYSDLLEERRAAVEAILGAGHIPAGMELFTAGDQSQMTVIKNWIDDSDVFLLILGGRYGSIEPISQKSYTHLEYEYALAKSKPLFAVVIDDLHLDAKVRQAGMSAIEMHRPNQLAEFRHLVLSKLVKFWRDPRDIKLAIHETLAEFSRRGELTGWVPGTEVATSAVLVDQLAQLTKENAELKDRLAKLVSSPILFNGLRFGELYTLMLNEPLDLGLATEGDKNLILRVVEAFGDTTPAVVHAFWLLRDVLQRSQVLLADELGVRKFVFYTLTRFGMLERSPNDNFTLTPEGVRFLLRLTLEKGSTAKSYSGPVFEQEAKGSAEKDMIDNPLRADRLLKMEEVLGTRVVSQQRVIERISQTLRRREAGLKDVEKPLGTFLFAGPSGVGKTLLARAIAEFIYESPQAVLQIDMSQYMEKHTVSRLVGAPPGYVGYEEGGQLTEQIRRKPNSLILLKDIEKAHPDIYSVLQQVIEDGHLTDSRNRLIDFSNSIIVLTSSVIAEKQPILGMKSEATMNPEDAYEAKTRFQLERTFSPEFLDHLDEVLVFQPLTHEDLKKVISLEVESVRSRLAERGLGFILTDQAKEFLLRNEVEMSSGARSLRRIITDQIETPLSEALLRQSFVGKTVITIGVANSDSAPRLEFQWE